MTEPAHPADAAGPNPQRAELASTVYAHLHAIAQRQMNSERRGHTLSATALVHEAYLRLGEERGELLRSYGRASYLHAAAEAMRRILIEHARARNRLKRGGGAARVRLEMIGDVADLDSIEQDGGERIVAFDAAFEALQKVQPEVAEIVRLRFYAGLSMPETAQVLGISERSAFNRWAFARAWLARRLKGEDEWTQGVPND